MDGRMYKKQFSIIAHALGVDIYKEKLEKLPDEFYRNRYVAGRRHRSWKTLMELYDKGWALRQRFERGEYIFQITISGQVSFKKHYEKKISKNT